MKTEAAASFAEILKSVVTEPGKISEAYTAFHNYSLGNQLLAMFQCAYRQIPLGPINTFKGWQALGRNVQRGQKAIQLCMPVQFKVKEQAEDGSETTGVRKGFVFRNNWFVLAQTEGDDYANEVVTPEWNAERALQSLEIEQTAFEHTNGNCQGYATHEGKIAINPIAEYPHKTRFHELAHVVLGHTREATMTDSEHTPKNIKEVEAESVAYILCTLLNLPGIEESRGYVQHWLSDGETISDKSAQKIFSAADKILKAGQAKAEAEAE